MTENKTLKLGEVLLHEGLIKHHQLVEALSVQEQDSRKLGELLLEKGWVDDEKLTKVLARIFQIPYIRIGDVKIAPAALDLVPYDLIEKYRILPLSVEEHSLTIATNDPLNMAALQEIQYRSGYVINPVMASRADIDEHIQDLAGHFHRTEAVKSKAEHKDQGSSVAQLVESILSNAVKEKASDIHLEPQENCLRVRFRIDGVLYEKAPVPKEVERNVISRIKILSGMDVAETRRPQDGRMSFSRGVVEYDIRISSLPDLLGENLSLRVLTKNFIATSFSDLGMEPRDAEVMLNLINRPYGLILVSGPTGAGKTTTLYSALNTLNDPSRNIISVEDPIEYGLKGINQPAVSHFTGYTFATAIRQILRHDPDVIMVGEIRDVETAEMAIRSALTGHLVFSTIHTNSAAGAVTRLLDMNIEPFLISSAVIGVIAQRLLRKLCPSCKKEYQPDAEMIARLKKMGGKADQISFSRAKGCDQCLGTGYQGRFGIFEVLKVDDVMRAMILKSATEKEIADQAKKNGMADLQMAGLQAALKKMTSIEEALRITCTE
jgi:type IV pilus assembly protein PilB